MKNTMKIKSLLSFFVPAAMMSLMVASCSDYDNGYDTNAIKFNEEFRKAYGDIDPEQDWNLAERGTVTVSTMKESEVKIYALRGNEYVLVGDYEGVKGTKMLGFDMVEGTQSIMVTDGVTAEKTVPGGVVTFGDTRTIHIGKTGDIEVEKIPAEGITIKEVTYQQYKYIESADYDAVRSVVPEIGYRQNHTNLNRVIHDFSYISNGEFVIYPYFWNTSSNNTIGVYYTDANGVPHEVDIYQNKGEGLEGIGEEYVDANLKNAKLVNGKLEGSVSKRTYSSGGRMAEYYQDYTSLIYVPLSGIQLYDLGLPNDITSYKKLVLEAELKNGTPDYRVIFYPLNSDGSVDTKNAITKTISAGNAEIDLTSSEFNSFPKNNCEIRLSGSANDKSPTWNHVMGLQGCRGDITFKKVQLVKNSNNWSQYNGGNANDIVQNNRQGRSQGIVVRIPERTKFGMYLKKTDGAVGDCTFYSESSKNNNEYTHGHGIIDYGNGTVNWDDTSFNPSYASTFMIGDQMFIGFEDWPNNTLAYGGGDFDLNDIVLAFDGSKPTIINEEPDSWLMVCEDLGGSFDTDYNDVIFKVDHVSGQPTARVTAMAAGGTLASYIFFRDPTTQNAQDQVIGEIHQMFGVASEKSGEYTPINAYSRFDKGGNTVSIDVGENWTLAYYQADQFHQGSFGNYGENVNMGGFQIRTLKSGTPDPGINIDANTGVFNSSSTASVIAAPDKGAAPYILCLPYKYTKVVGNKLNTYVWAWPQELCTICSAVYDQNDNYSGSNGGAYLEFGEWVRNHSKNVEWYKNRNVNALTVEELLLKSEDIQQGSNNGGNEQTGTQTSDFGVAVDNVPRGNSTSQGWDDANDHEVYLPEGTTLTLRPHHDNSGGTVTVGAFDNGNMSGVTTSKSAGETITGNVVISAQNLIASGTASITLHYSGDATYAPKDVTYTIKVASTTTQTIKVVSSEVGSVVGWYLNKADGEDRLKLNRDYGQPWVFEQVPGQSGYYYLYNLNNSVYLRLGDVNAWRPTLSSSLNPGDKGTFLIEYVSGGVRLKRKDGGYIGTSSDNDGYVYLNKDANSATWQLIPN